MRSFGCALLGIIDNVSLFISVKLVPTIIASLGVYTLSSSSYFFIRDIRKKDIICEYIFVKLVHYSATESTNFE